MEIQVIEKTNGRINRVTGTTIKERLRVCAYCRVSTDNEEQLNSYQSQLKYYDEKINSKSEWQFAGIYADEAITGTLDFKRTEFMRMIADSMSGKIDMILTKSLSRFARNTLDTLKYVRMLREKNIAILFEEENLNTTTGAGELMLTILSAMVLLGLKMKKDRGELIGYNGCYGYNYNIETFLEKIENILKENTTKTLVSKLEKDKEKINKKLNNLLELNLEGRINKEQYTLKFDELDTELIKIDSKIESLLKETNRTENIKQRLNKFKCLFKNIDIMPKFDKDVFECLIDKVIIGEILEDGTINPYTIRLICKKMVVR